MADNAAGIRHDTNGKKMEGNVDWQIIANFALRVHQSDLKVKKKYYK